MHEGGGHRTVLSAVWLATRGMVTMGADDLLFFIILGGMVLTIVYLRDQYSAQRRFRIAERGSELRLRELYRSRPAAQFKTAPPPEVSDQGICQIRQILKLALESPITRR